ncbi:hypothetical protein J7430_03535 [Xanthomonas axonopodis pv. begoniae]|nr:hypothetical protein [Xanthomonas axonopodis pv. begoniae]
MALRRRAVFCLSCSGADLRLPLIFGEAGRGHDDAHELPAPVSVIGTQTGLAVYLHLNQSQKTTTPAAKQLQAL